MKLLFNLEIVEGKRIRTRPGDYLKSLPHANSGQRAAGMKFMDIFTAGYF